MVLSMALSMVLSMVLSMALRDVLCHVHVLPQHLDPPWHHPSEVRFTAAFCSVHAMTLPGGAREATFPNPQSVVPGPAAL